MNLLKIFLPIVVLCCAGAGYRHQCNQYYVYSVQPPPNYYVVNNVVNPVVVQNNVGPVGFVLAQPMVPVYDSLYYSNGYYWINNRPGYWIYVNGYGWIYRFY